MKGRRGKEEHGTNIYLATSRPRGISTKFFEKWSFSPSARPVQNNILGQDAGIRGSLSLLPEWSLFPENYTMAKREYQRHAEYRTHKRPLKRYIRRGSRRLLPRTREKREYTHRGAVKLDVKRSPVGGQESELLRAEMNTQSTD